MEDEEIIYEEEEVVWAKIRGYPWWPAYVPCFTHRSVNFITSKEKKIKSMSIPLFSLAITLSKYEFSQFKTRWVEVKKICRELYRILQQGEIE